MSEDKDRESHATRKDSQKTLPFRARIRQSCKKVCNRLLVAASAALMWMEEDEDA